MTERNSCFVGQRCQDCPVRSIKSYRQELAATVVKTAVNDPATPELSQATPEQLVAVAQEAVDRVQGAVIPLGTIVGALTLIAAGECHQEPYSIEGDQF